MRRKGMKPEIVMRLVNHASKLIHRIYKREQPQRIRTAGDGDENFLTARQPAAIFKWWPQGTEGIRSRGHVAFFQAADQRSQRRLEIIAAQV